MPHLGASCKGVRIAIERFLGSIEGLGIQLRAVVRVEEVLSIDLYLGDGIVALGCRAGQGCRNTAEVLQAVTYSHSAREITNDNSEWIAIQLLSA